MDYKSHIPKIWGEALDKTTEITKEDVALFGKTNLLYLIMQYEAQLKKTNPHRKRKIYEKISDSLCKIRDIAMLESKTPIFSFYRNSDSFGDDEQIIIYSRERFFPATIVFKNKTQKELMINSSSIRLDFLERFVAIESPNVLSQSDFDYFRRKPEYAKLWFFISNQGNTNLDLQKILIALSEF